jgi:hypothetical protein
MKTTNDVMQKLAEDDSNYIVVEFTRPPRLVMKNGRGREICTVPQALFDDLRFRSAFLTREGDKWHLSDAGWAAARSANSDKH